MAKTECWLRPNRRILSIGLALPLLLTILGLTTALAISPESRLAWVHWLGGALVVVGVLMASVLLYLMYLPRLGYRDGHLLAYLLSTRPVYIPIENVECFFLGQASTQLTASPASESETMTIVVRLAESARQWHQRDIKPALGRWCDGYITIYGTWCEPINGAVAQRLNDRLIEAHRARRRGKRGASP